MNVMNKSIAVWSVSLAAALGAAGATPVAAQSFATVEQMKVAPGQDSTYLELEKAWKPLHEARVKAGLARGWYLYRVASPSGSSADHNYVTVAIYATFEAMENPYPQELLAKVIPAKDMDAFNKKTLVAREFVRSETWQTLGGLPETPLAKPAQFLRVEYMRVPAGGDAAYTAVEKEWRKIHEGRIKDGTVANWGLYGRVLPGGTDYPYSYATVTGYSHFKDMNGFDFAAAVQKAGLGDATALGDRTGKARDLVRAEDWVLVDYVQAQ
jgi:hypothetical protein